MTTRFVHHELLIRLIGFPQRPNGGIDSMSLRMSVPISGRAWFSRESPLQTGSLADELFFRAVARRGWLSRVTL